MKFKFFAIFLTSTLWLPAGVNRQIEATYIQKYKNKAIFLKIPVQGLQQVVFVTDTGLRMDQRRTTTALAFKVGDQVRITDLRFKADHVRFKIASIDSRRESELVFRFPSRLDEVFSRKESFEAALSDAFTEGLHYTELDSAKEEFVQDQFEEFLKRLAKTTATSVEFAAKAVLEKDPRYLAAKKQAAESKRELQKTAEDLQQENRARRALESQLSQLRNELTGKTSELDSVRDENQRLFNRRDTLQRQVVDLKKKIQEYERQINKLGRSLDVETASKADLGNRIKALSDSIDSLRSERSSLSQKLDEVNKELDGSRKGNESLKRKLKLKQRDNTRLRGDLRALTSNKDSLEARYLATKKQREILESAAKLSAALRLEKKREERKEGLFQVADLYLHTQKVGVLEVEVPTRPGKIYPVRFSLESPDTIQFTEEERELHQKLGEELKVETAWATSSDHLQAVLRNQEPLQTVAPRETVQWSWFLSGDPAKPELVSLRVHLINSDGQKILLEPQEFFVNPRGIVSLLFEHFSPLSVLAGTLLGVVFFGLLFGFRGRSRKSLANPRPDSGHPGDYEVPKEL